MIRLAARNGIVSGCKYFCYNVINGGALVFPDDVLESLPG